MKTSDVAIFKFRGLISEGKYSKYVEYYALHNSQGGRGEPIQNAWVPFHAAGHELSSFSQELQIRTVGLYFSPQQ